MQANSWTTGTSLKKVIVATVLTPDLAETRSFGTVTEELLALGDWLMACRVTHVAMEATGVYWKPVMNLLESYEFTAVWVVNPQQIKGMPGRKTDVQDSYWIAYLLRLGALKGSYIPSRPQRELREIVRYRKSLIQLRATEANRIQKVLEGANVKLGSVITDILGVTGQRILAALAAGETDPVALAQLADGRIRASQEDLAAALRGVVQRHQQLMLRVQLELITFLDRQIARSPGGGGAGRRQDQNLPGRSVSPPGGATGQETRRHGHRPPYPHRRLCHSENAGHRLPRSRHQLF